MFPKCPCPAAIASAVTDDRAVRELDYSRLSCCEERLALLGYDAMDERYGAGPVGDPLVHF